MKRPVFLVRPGYVITSEFVAKSWVFNDSTSWSSVTCSWLDGDTDSEESRNYVERNIFLIKWQPLLAFFKTFTRVGIFGVLPKCIFILQKWPNLNANLVLLLSISIRGYKSLPYCYKFLWVQILLIFRIYVKFAKISTHQTFQFWRFAKRNNLENVCRKTKLVKDSI